ncbi:MAG: hypothetical protein NTW08_01940 [Gammaproteobacteria bacterium]|nr:hypothetical protein [Gammaproteobacteria bacterium]
MIDKKLGFFPILTSPKPNFLDDFYASAMIFFAKYPEEIKYSRKRDHAYACSLIKMDKRYFLMSCGNIGKGVEGRVKLLLELTQDSENNIVTGDIFAIKIEEMDGPRQQREYKIASDVGLTLGPKLHRPTSSPNSKTYEKHYMPMHFWGESLSHYLMQNPQLALSTRISIIIQLCEKLHDLHEVKHIAHHDVKPGNMVINTDSQEVFFIDFGFSEYLSFHLDNFKTTGTEPYLLTDAKNRLIPLPAKMKDLYALAASINPASTKRSSILTQREVSKLPSFLKDQLQTDSGEAYLKTPHDTALKFAVKYMIYYYHATDYLLKAGFSTSQCAVLETCFFNKLSIDQQHHIQEIHHQSVTDNVKKSALISLIQPIMLKQIQTLCFEKLLAIKSYQLDECDPQIEAYFVLIQKQVDRLQDEIQGSALIDNLSTLDNALKVSFTPYTKLISFYQAEPDQQLVSQARALKQALLMLPIMTRADENLILTSPLVQSALIDLATCSLSLFDKLKPFAINEHDSVMANFIQSKKNQLENTINSKELTSVIQSLIQLQLTLLQFENATHYHTIIKIIHDFQHESASKQKLANHFLAFLMNSPCDVRLKVNLNTPILFYQLVDMLQQECSKRLENLPASKAEAFKKEILCTNEYNIYEMYQIYKRIGVEKEHFEVASIVKYGLR